MLKFIWRLSQIGLVVVGSLVFIAGLIGHLVSAPGHEGPTTAHFDGKRFHNHQSVRLPNLWMAGKYLATMERGPWMKWRENPPHTPPPPHVNDGIRVTFVNHSTVLVQIDGFNILTDPIWSNRTSPIRWAGPKRHHAPGVALEDLPAIDLILISHNHYDHLDVPTLLQIAETHDPLIATGLGNELYLRSVGWPHDIAAMDWGDEMMMEGLRIVGQPSRHFSSRGLTDRMATLWLSFVVEGPSGTVYFAGDTGYGKHFEETRRAFPSIDVALLPIGAYAPRWFMAPVHMDPVQAVAAHRDLGAQTSVALHYGTFRLSDEGQDQPKQELQVALQNAGLSEHDFWVLEPGEGRLATGSEPRPR